ncbi:hypothetical protein [Caudoviricetes sp.]|nr:hypothetical protein [Caudoviricetes sp.]
MFDEDWFTGKGDSKGFTSRAIADLRKRKEEEQYSAEILKQQQAEEADKKQAEINSKKSVKDRFGDIAIGTGRFIKGAAVDLKDTTVGVWQGMGDIGRGELASDNLEEVSKARLEMTQRHTKEMNAILGNAEDATKLDAEGKKKWDEFVARSNKEREDFNAANAEKEKAANEDIGTAQKVDAKKLAFQSGETVINIGTLGLTSVPKQLAKQGLKTLAKQAFKSAIKTGGKELVEQMVKEGGEQLIKKGAQEVLEEGAEQVVKQTGKQILKKAAQEGGKDALIGTAYGVTQTGKNNPDAELNDYLVNMAFGAGVGFAIPIVGAGAKAGVKKVASNISPKALKTGAKIADSADPNDVNALINKTIDEQSEKYGKGAFTRIKEWVGDQIDPNRAFAKIDDAYAKTNGLKRNKLNADESLEDLARRSAVSEREAASLFEKPLSDGRSAKDLVVKYKGDSAAGKEFNNYTNAKFDLEFREKNGFKKRIQQGLDDDQLKQFVEDYETRNPESVKDLALKKEINDMAVDYMADSGAISRAEAEQIKKAYKNAVPLERVFPDDLARPEVTGKNIGSIAKQTVIQRLEGGSDIPLSNSFDTMLNRVYKAVSQGNRAKLAQKLLERQEAGLIKGGKIAITAGNKEARFAIREQIQLVNKGVRYLQKKTVISNRQMRKIASEINKLEKSGLNLALKEGGKESLPDFTPSVLSKLKDQKGKTVGARQFYKALIEADPKDMKAIRDKVAVREPKLAGKLDEIANYRTQIDSLKAVKTDMKEVVAEFVDDPTTGKQVISGIIDGQSYKMEVPPDLAKAVMGLDQQKLPSVLKALAIVKKPFEVTWTGVLNPVFSAISFVLYDTPMSVINSPQGFKTFGPKAVKESIKSFWSSSDFQKRLAAEGARPYGGSGASAFIKPDAKALAAQRNILTKIKYTASNPEVALSKLDVWGGKLANSTRTRIARAAYDDALRIAKKEGKDITDTAVQKRAMENATLAYRSIMPDFDTMSSLTRQINSVVPFYAASVAGTRSLGKALKRDPLGTSVKLVGLGVAPTVGITAFSLANPAGQEFYAEMERTNPRLLDENMVVVMPGAYKDDETGEWKGIVKVPLAPEFRAINRTTWRTTRAALGKGSGPEASQIAWSLFDAATGGVRSGENPLISTRRILSGEDPRTGERIIKGDMANLPKEEQLYESTSPAGKFVGKVLNTSPIQGDKILSQFGIVGQAAKNGGDPVEAVVGNVENRFSGAYGETASRAFYDTYSPVKAKRDRVSKEVTTLIQSGRINEAKRKAEGFNSTLGGKFSEFNKQYGGSEAYDPNWDDLMSGLFIRTGERSIEARQRQ